jgi:hypothetical protein
MPAEVHRPVGGAVEVVACQLLDLFNRVLADIRDIDEPGNPVSRRMARIAQADRPDFGSTIDPVIIWILEWNPVVPQRVRWKVVAIYLPDLNTQQLAKQ